MGDCLTGRPEYAPHAQHGIARVCCQGFARARRGTPQMGQSVMLVSPRQMRRSQASKQASHDIDCRNGVCEVALTSALIGTIAVTLLSLAYRHFAGRQETGAAA